ncbi:MAG: alpha/beta hydrolase-fold protein [Gemmatimonadota bacterium]
MRRLAPFCLVLLLPSAISAQATPDNRVTIGTIDSVWSGTLKESRKYWVYTPGSYNDSTYLPQKYPVLYLLDGDAHFHSVTGLLQFLGSGINGVFLVPEMIVVAIPNTDRARDLTPTHVEKGLDGKPAPFFKTTGGMPNFFQFIKNELIPKVEGSYRTAPYRILVGHSLGGIAAIDALYTIPETFNAYIAIDPSLWWDDRVLLKKAKDYFSKPGVANRALFVGQANTINAADTSANMHFSSILQFNSVLENYNQSGLRYAYKYYPDDSHGSVPLMAEYDALRFIFASYKSDLFQALERPEFIKEQYAKVSAALGYTVQPPESMMDILGHIELSRDTTKAIALFQMNADLYPNSPKVYDALGEGWQAKGDSKKATEYYEKSLALKPSNQHAKDMIKKISEGKR